MLHHISPTLEEILAKFLPHLQCNDTFQKETAGAFLQGTKVKKKNFGYSFVLIHFGGNKTLAIFLV